MKPRLRKLIELSELSFILGSFELTPTANISSRLEN